MSYNRSNVWFMCCLALACTLPSGSLIGDDGRIEEGEMAGYLLVPNERVAETYNAGFSMYVAAWPLLEEYPGNRFQTGLFGTWMHPQYDSPPTEKLHQKWTRDREYLAPPNTGSLADVDPALVVTPPPGLEIGYVPIVTRQAAAE